MGRPCRPAGKPTAFDRLWRGKTPWHRSQAYKALAEALGFATHISWMDVPECKRVVGRARAAHCSYGKANTGNDDAAADWWPVSPGGESGRGDFPGTGWTRARPRPMWRSCMDAMGESSWP